MNGRRTNGFSGKDLVTVLAVLCVLVLVFLYVFPWDHGGHRKMGLQAACMSNLRQIGACLMQYSAENDDFFPPASNWLEAPRKYASIAEIKGSILACPQKPEQIGYGMNSRFEVPVDIRDVRKQSSTMVVSETIAGEVFSEAKDLDFTRHPGGANGLFLDGHVEAFSREEMEKHPEFFELNLQETPHTR